MIVTDDDHPSYDVMLRGGDIAIDDNLFAVLKGKHRELLEKLDPSGHADVKLRLVKEWLSDSESMISYEGTVGLRQGRFRLRNPLSEKDGSEKGGHELTDIDGVISIKGTTSSEREELSGKLDVSSLTIWKLPLTDVQAGFERNAGGWSFRDLHAKLYEGEVTGDLQIRQGSRQGFATTLKLKDLQLATIGTDLLNMRVGQVRGKLSGDVQLQGDTVRMADLIGHADLRVREGKLWELPVILSVLNVLNIPPLDRTAFTEVNTEVDIFDDGFHLKQLDLLGNTVSIYGDGHIAASGEMDLNFLVGISRLAVPDVPIVGDLVKAAQKQIITVHAGGTVRDTKIELEPIAPVTGTIRAVLGGVLGSDRDKSDAADQRKSK